MTTQTPPTHIRGTSRCQHLRSKPGGEPLNFDPSSCLSGECVCGNTPPEREPHVEGTSWLLCDKKHMPQRGSSLMTFGLLCATLWQHVDQEWLLYFTQWLVSFKGAPSFFHVFNTTSPPAVLPQTSKAASLFLHIDQSGAGCGHRQRNLTPFFNQNVNFFTLGVSDPVLRVDRTNVTSAVILTLLSLSSTLCS